MRLKISTRLLLAALIFLVVAYGADSLSVRSKMAGARGGEAFGTVTFYVATPLKNKRVEVFYDQPQTEICVHSLFPHFGRRPCWYAGRDPVRISGVGSRALSLTLRQ
jgi:hypothetical protein